MTTTLQCGQCEGLLPWYVNNTASAADRALVDAHLRSCMKCSERLRGEQSLLQHLRASASVPVPDAAESWRRFEPTLGDAAPADRPAGPSPLLRWVVGAQAAALVVMSVLLAQTLWNRQRNEPDFRTVTTPPAALPGFALRVAVAPGVTPQTMAQIAREHGARVVSGPSEQGVYTLEIEPASLQQLALARLRAIPGLLLVEPVSGR